MRLPTPSRRWLTRGGAAAVAVAAASAGTQAIAMAAPIPAASTLAAPARVAPAATSAGATADPYSPAYQHPYRRGVVPTRAAAAKMRTWAAAHPGAAAASAVQPSSASNLFYGGGVDGIGVTTGHEKVYLVFYGNNWGTETTGSIDTFSNDPSGEATRLQQLFMGLGTHSDEWSGVMTQYCQGVRFGAQTCPSSAPHVAYPRGGVLAGVWYDNSAASPAQASAFQLGTEAVHAANHFGNTTGARNRDAQYVILSPTGANPDNYENQGFCAWHDYNGDPYVGVTSPYGDIAFTNFPYVTDAGQSCGSNFVNSGSTGTDDGISIVEGHEYAETITDQNPAGGWLDSENPSEENGDKCAWKSSGTGHAANLALATGTFAMQGTWSNAANNGKGGCAFTHSIVSTQLLKNPGFESGKISPWTSTSGVLHKKSSSFPAHSGSWLARLDGRSGPHTDTLAQKVKVAPSNGTYTAASFSFWLRVKTNDPASKASDTLKVEVLNSGGAVVATLHTYSNKDATSGYVHHSFSLNAYAGQTITIKFIGKETLAHHNTSFFIDDNALKAD